MAKLGIDCDGVLADFVRGLNPYLGLSPEFEPSNWDYKGTVTKSELNVAIKQAMATPNFFLNLEAYRDNVSQLARWMGREYGHDVWIVTSRFDTVGFSAAWQTQEWLKECGIKGYFNSFNTIVVPWSEDKVDVCSRLDIRWIIDDKTETIESMDQFPYLNAALMDRPWNQDAKVKWRVKSMQEFLDRMKNA